MFFLFRSKRSKFMAPTSFPVYPINKRRGLFGGISPPYVYPVPFIIIPCSSSGRLSTVSRRPLPFVYPFSHTRTESINERVSRRLSQAHLKHYISCISVVRSPVLPMPYFRFHSRPEFHTRLTILSVSTSLFTMLRSDFI